MKREFISEKEMSLIRQRIKELKEEISSAKYDKVRDLYLRLNEIVNLKRRIDPNYTPRSLEKEADEKILKQIKEMLK